MRYLTSDSTDIRYNLALETYLMEHADLSEPILYFYINSPCIILGRYQNAYEEINQQYVSDHNIIITRRTSGGGAVFDDLGNVSFSFITKDDGDAVGNFARFTEPVLEALHQLGAVNAQLSGRNDLQIDGKKFSGNAMHAQNGRLFAHGTLMYDVDLTQIEHALNVPKDKIASKGIKSVHSRVTNLKPYFDPEFQQLTIEEFRDKLALQILGLTDLSDADRYFINTETKQGVQNLLDQYYQNWDWIYGKSPAFSLQHRKHFTAGTVDYRLNVEAGHIKQIKIYGDFFGQGVIQDVEQKLIGVQFEKQAVRAVFATLDIPFYFGNILSESLVDLLVNQQTGLKN
ncbi:lipoate--protein ligase [Paucilactobacillus kaifaensis]|uniref:lipoate--protein ligase n=1 Tax=Paucilactobacillus kaifaensis TaxID=2559921 RepID=UPI0010F4B47D|nr:lipoate--protein ligase [Paucilactobacillus kaifaensis]